MINIITNRKSYKRINKKINTKITKLQNASKNGCFFYKEINE